MNQCVQDHPLTRMMNTVEKTLFPDGYSKGQQESLDAMTMMREKAAKAIAENDDEVLSEMMWEWSMVVDSMKLVGMLRCLPAA